MKRFEIVMKQYFIHVIIYYFYLHTDSVVGGVIEHIEEDVSASVPPLRDGCPHEGVPCRPCHDVSVVLPHLHHVKHSG